MHEKEHQALAVPHAVRLENRERAIIMGVVDVDSFHELEIDLVTTAGLMMITGRDLHIRSLNLEEGQLIVEGSLDSLVYAQAEAPKEGVFARLFR